MKKIKGKPGVILLPVVAVFIIFIVLLVMLIAQRQSNNAIVLEYKASRVMDILLDLYLNGQNLTPEELDESITGFGVYEHDKKSVFRYGSAPEVLPDLRSRGGDVIFNGNEKIVIIRPAPGDSPGLPGTGPMMQRMAPNMQKRLLEMRNSRSNGQSMPMILQKYQVGVYLEYRNGSFQSERRLKFLMIFLFILIFTITFILIFRLYDTNRRLLLKTEHDKQLIQLGEAARTLAHEIRNPLSTLKLQRDLLTKKLPPEYSINLDVIDRELKRLNILVDRVGDFLKNPVGQPEKIKLSAFIENLYGGREDVVFSASEEEVIIAFDAERLRTVLDNVVNNAIDAGGRAELAVRKEAGRSCLTVCDRGRGISDEAMKRMFDPFFTTKNNGTGLGLSIVDRLMKSAGGLVEAANMKEGGASVTLVFGDVHESSDS